ncbi:SAM-dependent methyltransferase [Streptomyces sp. NPDC093085]|uniref:SAM-dependent methyltransferase n=1 Tax=Streptomyces sp. NPDC093085 TaxID=3155068 RepID=UPI003415A63E
MAVGTPKPQIDTSRPHPARVYDYLLGGKDNYDVDRAVAERLPAEATTGAVQNRAFMRRAAVWLARQGVDQYLDIGTGIPTEPNLHQLVQRTVPAARIVYTDNDPIVLRHAEALLVSTEEGTTDYIQADVRAPGEILEHARAILDFDRPIALSLIALMHFVPDDEEAYAITRTLVESLPPGSYLVLSNASRDLQPEQAEQVLAEYAKGGITLGLRTGAEVARFFEGLEMVEPGLVTVTQWRPDDVAVLEESGVYAGVGRVR